MCSQPVLVMRTMVRLGPLNYIPPQKHHMESIAGQTPRALTDCPDRFMKPHRKVRVPKGRNKGDKSFLQVIVLWYPALEFSPADK